MSPDSVRLDADRVVPAEHPLPYRACFSVRAAAEPGSLPRILEIFAKRGLVPSSIQARLTGDAEPALSIDLQIAGLEPALVEILAETLRQIWVVERVLTAEVLPARGVSP